jgi:hypothetical protein
MAFVTIDNFDETKLRVGEILVKDKPVNFQKVLIKYAYDKVEAPLVIRTPVLNSFGLCVNKDINNKDKVSGYSTPFLCHENSTPKTDKEEKFISVMEKITDFCNKTLQDNSELIKKNGRRKPVKDADLTILKTKEDKPNSAPVIYAKMMVNKEGSITTPFYRKKTKRDTTTGKKIYFGKFVKVDPLDYIKKKLTIIGLIKIESIFIGANIESIQVKLAEATVVKKIESDGSFWEGVDDELGSDSDTVVVDSEPESE